MACWGHHEFFSNSILFSLFDRSHFYVVSAAALLLFILVVAAKRLSNQQNLLVSEGLSLLLGATVMLWSPVHLSSSRFNANQSLSLSIYNLFALIAPLLFWIPNQKRFEVIYYFVFFGTLQAIITPDPSSGYPSYSFLNTELCTAVKLSLLPITLGLLNCIQLCGELGAHLFD